MIFTLWPLVATSLGSVLSAAECSQQIRILACRVAIDFRGAQAASLQFLAACQKHPQSSPASSRLWQAGSLRSPEETLRLG